MNLKDLLKFIVERVRALDAELIANQRALAAFIVAYPQHTQILNDALTASRQSHVLAEMMRRKYDVPLEKWLQEDADSLTVEEALKLFREMKQTDQIN